MVGSYRPSAELEVINPWALYQVDPLSEVKGFISSKLVAQMVKNLPAIQETWIQSLGQEDALQKGMATHSHILTWRIPWTEEPGGLQSMGLQRVGHDWTQTTRKPSLAFLSCLVSQSLHLTGTEPAGIFGRNHMIRNMSLHVTPWKKKWGLIRVIICGCFFFRYCCLSVKELEKNSLNKYTV